MDSDLKTLFSLLAILGSFSGTVLSLQTYGVQDLCGGSIQLKSPLFGLESSAILKPKQDGPYNDDSVCSLVVRRHLPNHKLVVSLSMRELRPEHLDVLEIDYRYGNDVWKHIHFNHYRHYDPNESACYLSSEDVTITFSTKPGATSTAYFKGFELVVTLAQDAPCGLHQFSCNSTLLCIADALECDGKNHCGNMSDHLHCPTTTTPHYRHTTVLPPYVIAKRKRMVLGLSIGIPVGIVFLSACLYLMWRRKCCTTSSTSTRGTWLNLFSMNTSSSSYKGGSATTSAYVGSVAAGGYSASSSVYVGSSAATCSPAC